MDQAPTGRDHDPTKKGEHLEDPMMGTMDAKARAAQEAAARKEALAAEMRGGSMAIAAEASTTYSPRSIEVNTMLPEPKNG